jgi:hypothetical protein
MTDTSLEQLARRLRMLGFDVVSIGDSRLEQTFEAARRDGRIVLTLSSRHPRRYADVPAVVIAGDDPMAAVRELAEIYEPAGPPFSRCSICNHLLESRTVEEAVGRVPEQVRRSAPTLHHCPGCGKWYWMGSHVDRMRTWLERALRRPMPDPGQGSGGAQE